MNEKRKNDKRETSKDQVKRQDWERNHLAITESYLKLYQSLKRPPTQGEIGAACKLSRDAVSRHLSELKIEDVTPSIKLRTQRVLLGLTAKAEKGDPSAVKLWMQLVHGWKETQLHDIPPDSNFEIIIGKRK